MRHTVCLKPHQTDLPNMISCILIINPQSDISGGKYSKSSGTNESLGTIPFPHLIIQNLPNFVNSGLSQSRKQNPIVHMIRKNKSNDLHGVPRGI